MASVNFADIITFTRASGGGRFNAQGQYEWVPANEPRIDYDPVTGECRGLLIEESRTNLLTYSSTFSGHWQSRVNELAGVRGFAKTTELIAREATTGAHQWRGYSATLASGGTYTLSLLVKAGASDVLRLRYAGAEGINPVATFDLVNGSVINKGMGISNATIQNYGGGYWLASITAVQGSATTGYLDIGRGLSTGSLSEASYNGDGVTVQFTVLHNQIEAGSFPTSYIPTTTAQVTRAADMASVNDLSPWYNASEGTLLADVELRNVGGLGILGLRNSSASTERVSVYQNGNFNNYQAQVVSGGTTQAQLAYGVTVKGFGKFALAMKKDSFAVSSNGSVPSTDSAGLIPVGLDYMEIGNGYALRQINGHIRMVKYLPKRVSNSELQAMTQV